VITNQLADSQGESQHAVQLALTDALRNNPQVIFAPLDADDAINLAQAIAKLPTERQPTLLVGGGLVQPPALQQLAQWARTQQLALPHIYIVAASAARPPIGSDWQKQFYAVFCTLFAHPGSYCSGAAILEQGALLFGDGIALLTKGLGTSTNAGQLPDARQLIKRLKGTSLAGVSGEITLQLRNDVLITNTKATPVILALQQDGSIQVTG
ncbi:MAG: hypothetical protein J2P37_06470, partial [Ktedonobacteraceae bacterium]|nr:hypothetical protein [Ktedonobacteraceae bacterium]